MVDLTGESDRGRVERGSLRRLLGAGLALATPILACQSRPELQPQPPPGVVVAASKEPSGGGPPRPVRDEERGQDAAGCLQVLWCASGGAALVGDPIVDDRERVYVATSDGYLHAFERDGRFRFSYTVDGTPLGSVSLRASDGVILIGTTAGKIYGIAQTGTLRFRHFTPTSVWSGLYPLNDHAVTFLGLDERLYAVTNAGRALYRVRAPSTPTTEPVVGPKDVVWVGLQGAVARFVAAYKLELLDIDRAGAGPVEQLIALDDSAIARASGRAFLVTSGQSAVDLGPVEQLGGDGKRAVLIHDGQARLVEVESKQQAGRDVVAPRSIRRWSLAHPAGRFPVALAGTQVFVPGDDGVLTIYDTERVICSERVADSALHKPQLARSRRFLVVADQNGRFCAMAPQFSAVD